MTDGTGGNAGKTVSWDVYHERPGTGVAMSGGRRPGCWVPSAPYGPAMARQHVRAVLGDWQECRQRTEAAALVASELVTNAFVHGRGGPAGVWCQLERTPAGVRVGIWSRSAPVGGAPKPRPPENVEVDCDVTQLAESGRGLLIVAGVSRDWGTQEGAMGRMVWAEV